MNKEESAAVEGAKTAEAKVTETVDSQNQPDKEVVALSKALLRKDNKISDLERRLNQLEKRLKTNERFARTFANCMDTQVVAIDAVTSVVRRALKTDAEIANDLSLAIHEYDRHKIRRWFSGILGVFLWVGSVIVSAFVGALIYWIFSAN